MTRNSKPCPNYTRTINFYHRTKHKITTKLGLLRKGITQCHNSEMKRVYIRLVKKNLAGTWSQQTVPYGWHCKECNHFEIDEKKEES